MEKTIITQHNTQVLTAPETWEYKIETTVTEKGELPFTQIFVYTIVDPEDPGQDAFARVATPGDLDGESELKVSRDLAVAADESAFLSSYFSVQYPDLTVAAQAKTAITTRINELINKWIVYRDQFMADTDTPLYYPTVDPGLEEALIDAYAEAKQTRITAEEELDAATVALTLAEKDADTAQQIYEIYLNDDAFCKKTYKTDWPVFSGAVSTIITAGTDFVTASKTAYCALAGLAISETVTWPPTSTQLASLAALSVSWTNWYNAILTFEGAQNGYSTVGAPAKTEVQTGLSDFNNTTVSSVAYYYNAKKAADSLVADAVLTKKEAEATLAAAQKAEDEALAKVLEVCPTFDSSSV